MTPRDPAVPSAAPEAVRLRAPVEVVQVIPELCGFVPQDSLVVVSVRGRRQRVGLTMRVDLPPADDRGAGRALAAQLAARLHADGARAALLSVWTGAGELDGRLPQEQLVADVARALRRAGAPTLSQLLVADGRWWSYDCTDDCCPRQGTPLPDATVPAVRSVAAQRVLAGRAVLPSRAAVAASFTPDADDLPALRAQLTAARGQWQGRLRAEGRVRSGQAALRAWRRALDDAPPAAPAPEQAAGLLVALDDVLVRDEVLTWALQDGDRLLPLLLALAAQAPPPADVAVCTLVAWTAHLRGDGALANVALDRALASDPACGLARLGRQALDAQVGPDPLAEVLSQARAALRRDHPWTGLASLAA